MWYVFFKNDENTNNLFGRPKNTLYKITRKSFIYLFPLSYLSIFGQQIYLAGLVSRYIVKAT